MNGHAQAWAILAPTSQARMCRLARSSTDSEVPPDDHYVNLFELESEMRMDPHLTSRQLNLEIAFAQTWMTDFEAVDWVLQRSDPTTLIE